MSSPGAGLSDLMRAPRTAPRDATIAEAAILMQNWHVGALVLVDEKRKPSGLVTDRDLALGSILRELDPGTAKVEECARQPLITIPINMSIASAAGKMREHQVRRLGVLDDDGALCGVLTLDAILGHLGSLAAGLAGAIHHEIELEAESVRTPTAFGAE
jgi:CBS domain-containing protein